MTSGIQVWHGDRIEVLPSAMAVRSVNDLRKIRHVRIAWDDDASRWAIDCDRCHGMPDHCGWWVQPAEMARRLAAHGEKHARCRP